MDRYCWPDVRLLVRSKMIHRMGRLGLQMLVCGGCCCWLVVRNGVGSRRLRGWRSWNRLEGGSKKGRSREAAVTLGRLLLLYPSLTGILSLGCVPVRNRSVRWKGLVLMMMVPLR